MKQIRSGPLRVLVTGVTGTLGKKLVNKLLSEHENIKIIGISRDEQKQQSMPKDDRLALRICDVRNIQSLERLMWEYDWPSFHYCFHLAALKCVDILEENPRESYLTNVLGTQNVADLCLRRSAKLIFTSTDKAVYPINVYGQSKAIGEKIVLASSKKNVVVRYGNVIGSRGSFIPKLAKTLKDENKAYVTDINMTRFWIKDQKACEFVYSMTGSCFSGIKVMYPMQSCRVIDIVNSVAKHLNISDFHIEEIGMRPGEKIHEDLATRYETVSGKDISSNGPVTMMDEKQTFEFLEEMGINEFI